MKPILIVGTDTGVGKTIVTAALAAYWQHYRNPNSLGIYKPIQSGEGDREYYHRVLHLTQSLAEITPLYYQTPVAPAIAALQEAQPIDLAKIWQQFQHLQSQKECLLVEALGGLGSPITNDYIVADLAADWHLDTFLVVPVRLGAIGQAVANVALARSRQVRLRGMILSAGSPNVDVANHAPIDLIENLTQIPVLGILPYIHNLEDTKELAHAASALAIEQLGFTD